MSTLEVPPVATCDDPRATAKAILDPWWERQVPRPTQNYMGALKVLERALRAGWPEDSLRSALDEIPTISGGCLQFWWNRNRNRRVAKPTAARSVRLQAIEHDAALVLSGVLDYNEVGPDVRALVDQKLGETRRYTAIEAVAS